MKQSIFLKGLVFALVALPLAVGCKKKETAAPAGSAVPTGSPGSATAPATGSGSAVAASGSGSAAAATGSGSAAGPGSAVAAATGSGSAAGSAAAGPTAPWAADVEPAAATSKIAGKRDGNDQGTFDRAIYFKVTDKYGSTSYQLHLSSGCEKFSCAHYAVMNGGIYSGDKHSADCPDAKTMDITIDGDADPKVGPVDLDVSINSPSSGGGLSGKPMKGSSLTSVTDKEVKGKIDVKDGNNEAKGDFTAKNCGTMVFPKE